MIKKKVEGGTLNRLLWPLPQKKTKVYTSPPQKKKNSPRWGHLAVVRQNQLKPHVLGSDDSYFTQTGELNKGYQHYERSSWDNVLGRTSISYQ